MGYRLWRLAREVGLSVYESLVLEINVYKKLLGRSRTIKIRQQISPGRKNRYLRNDEPEHCIVFGKKIFRQLPQVR